MTYTSLDLGQGAGRKMQPGPGPGSFAPEYSVLLSTPCRWPWTKGKGDIVWSWVGAALRLTFPLTPSPIPRRCRTDGSSASFESQLRGPMALTNQITVTKQALVNDKAPDLTFSSCLTLAS